MEGEGGGKVKKLFIIFLLITVLLLSALQINKKSNEKELNNDISTDANKGSGVLVQNNTNTENKNTENDKSWYEINYKSETEDGFLSSINAEGTEDEIIKNNKLQVSENYTVNEKLMAKNTAENFVQAICSINIDNLNESVGKITNLVVEEKKEEIEALYMYVGKDENKKGTVIEKVQSWEMINKSDKDYIVFKVKVNWSMDQQERKTAEGYECYEVTLIKVNNEFKVAEYMIS